MGLYSAADIVGKSLYAKANIPLKRYAADSAPTIYTAKPVELVGVVYSYLFKDGAVWWMFYDKNNVAYYSKHGENLYDLTALQEQGVLDTKTKLENEAKANETTKDFIERNIKWVAIIVGVFLLGKEAIKKI